MESRYVLPEDVDPEYARLVEERWARKRISDAELLDIRYRLNLEPSRDELRFLAWRLIYDIESRNREIARLKEAENR